MLPSFFALALAASSFLMTPIMAAAVPDVQLNPEAVPAAVLDMIKRIDARAAAAPFELPPQNTTDQPEVTSDANRKPLPPYCKPRSRTATEKDAHYAAEYVSRLTQPCKLKGKKDTFVGVARFGTATVGFGSYHGGEVTMPCKTVGEFALHVVNHCTFNQRTYGYQYVPGNRYHAKGFKPDDTTVLVVVY